MTAYCATSPSPSTHLDSRTRLLVLAAQLARVLPDLSTLEAKRVQGRPSAGGTRGPLREMHTQEEPHSSIQVKPNTRPSLRDGRTAYAALSREPNSFWPPSLPRNSPAPRRLARLPHSQELDRSNDGQDHTVLPYARSLTATSSPGLVDVAGRTIGETNSTAPLVRTQSRAHGEQSAPPFTSRALRCRVHRKPGSRT